MASATVTDLPSDYCKEELDLILPEVGSLEKEDLNESDVEIEGDDKEEEESDSDDDIPLSVFMATWHPASTAPVVREFTHYTADRTV